MGGVGGLQRSGGDPGTLRYGYKPAQQLRGGRAERERGVF